MSCVNFDAAEAGVTRTSQAPRAPATADQRRQGVFSQANGVTFLTVTF